MAPSSGLGSGVVRRALRIVCINFALLLAVVLAAELIFGHWLSRDPLDRLDIFRNGSVKVDARALYPGGRIFVYRRDNWGFRGGGVDPAAIDILTIGGSTTNQMYLEEESTWQAALARALAERGRAMVVANAGLDGQSTVGHIRSLEAWFPHVPGLKPRIVLAYVGINDVAAGGLSIDTLKFSSIHKELRYNSALIRLGRVIEGAIAAKKAQLNHHKVDYGHASWTDVMNVPDDRAVSPQFDPFAYGKRLRTMVGAIRAMGALPVLVTQVRGDARYVDGRILGLAAAKGPNGADRGRLVARLNEVTLLACRETGAVCLDLAGEVAFVDGDFYDEVHSSPQGAEKIGRWLAARLEMLL